ncbi:MAG: C10 family peptidase [Verrucomicrobiota bacterium]|jgi:hypothetical protein
MTLASMECYHHFRLLRKRGAVALACLLISSGAAVAAPVAAGAATGAVQGWLHQDRRPLGAPLSAQIKSTETVKNAAGEALFHVVRLDPFGFVILPADDLVDPIVAFSPNGSFDPSSQGPLAAMINRDLPRRMARARAGVAAAGSRAKWHAFLASSPNPPPDSEENGTITLVSQIWVAPFVQTLWDQGAAINTDYACYNYYTPPGPNGDANNDVCGCVATSMAQLMYYFQYPTTGVGTASFAITNNGTTEMTSLLGGDGSGGPYVWSSMPLSPNQPTSAQAIAIGALIHDAGATVHMYYTPSGSSAYTYLFQQALTSTFKFANAGYYENDASGISGSNLLNMINPNVDARLPVSLGISGDVGGHCVVVDGYGYSASALFHHVNAGWGGDDDIWYALPGIDTADNGDFTIIQACIYNVYTNGSGQIISGRVTDPTGAPVPGATVTAVRTGGGTYSATTDTNGIYALARIPASSSYTLTATKTGDASATNSYSTGTSVYNALPSGNVWGANFVLTPPLLVTSKTGFATIGPTNGPFAVFSQTCTLTNTSASSINWALSNTNNWLSVTAISGALEAGAAVNLTVTLSSAANSLASGTYMGSIWITNMNNGFAQQLQFSIVVATADYPIAVTGFNMDVVVENTAVGGDSYNYADTFDPECLLSGGSPICFYESGLVASNLYGGASALGLPTNGLLTSDFDHATTFQFAPYGSSNALYLTSTSNSASLTFDTPMACKSLSVLAASAQGGGNGTLVVHFADGAASSDIPFNAANYMTTNTAGAGAAITNFGILEVGGPFYEYYSLDYSYWFPSLYQTSINLISLGLNTKPITSVTFTMPSGTGTTTSTVTGIFALSGTEAPLTNSPASFVASHGSMSLSAGRFTMELTNLIGQGPVVISASTNLLQWVNIYTNPSGYGTAFVTDSNAGTFPRRFYRAATP